MEKCWISKFLLSWSSIECSHMSVSLSPLYHLSTLLVYYLEYILKLYLQKKLTEEYQKTTEKKLHLKQQYLMILETTYENPPTTPSRCWRQRQYKVMISCILDELSNFSKSLFIVFVLSLFFRFL